MVQELVSRLARIGVAARRADIVGMGRMMAAMPNGRIRVCDRFMQLSPSRHDRLCDQAQPKEQQQAVAEQSRNALAAIEGHKLEG